MLLLCQFGGGGGRVVAYMGVRDRGYCFDPICEVLRQLVLLGINIQNETYLQIDMHGEKYLAHEHILKTVGHLNCHACSLCG